MGSEAKDQGEMISLRDIRLLRSYATIHKMRALNETQQSLAGHDIEPDLTLEKQSESVLSDK